MCGNVERDDEIFAYASEFPRWQETLGARVFFGAFIGSREMLAVLADAVWNMTFLGLDEKTVDRKIAEIEYDLMERPEGGEVDFDIDFSSDDLGDSHSKMHAEGSPMLKGCLFRELEFQASCLRDFLGACESVTEGVGCRGRRRALLAEGPSYRFG